MSGARRATENPMEAIADMLAFNSRDWSKPDCGLRTDGDGVTPAWERVERPEGGRVNSELRRRIAIAGEQPEAERIASPPELHQPHWDGLGKPHSWICQVCWGDGWSTMWPCKVAQQYGKAVAEAGGLDFSW